MKFLHAADLHLDSPLHGLERYEGAPVEEIRGATRRTLENLVRLAIEQQVAFVMLAGDQYDGDHDDYRTVLFFTQQMIRLRDSRRCHSAAHRGVEEQRLRAQALRDEPVPRELLDQLPASATQIFSHRKLPRCTRVSVMPIG